MSEVEVDSVTGFLRQALPRTPLSNPQGTSLWEEASGSGVLQHKPQSDELMGNCNSRRRQSDLWGEEAGREGEDI